jgi:hypothetical protein
MAAVLFLFFELPEATTSSSHILLLLMPNFKVTGRRSAGHEIVTLWKYVTFFD